MLRLMIQKLKHKKWMALCLIISNCLLISVASGYPLFKNGSAKRMLNDELAAYAVENNVNPGIIDFHSTANKGQNLNDFVEMDGYAYSLPDYLGLEMQSRSIHYNLISSKAASTLARDDIRDQMVKIGSVSNLALHSKVLAGRMYEKMRDKDGCFEAVVTNDALVKLNVLLDEVIKFPNLKDENGKEIKVKIVGVIEPDRTSEDTVFLSSSNYEDEFLISQELFSNTFLSKNIRNYYIHGDWYLLLKVGEITSKKMPSLVKKTEDFVSQSVITKQISTPGYLEVINKYQKLENKIDVTLIILQVPVMTLLLAFIFMLSNQLLSLEQNEISLLKSRGASKGQIGLLYLSQSGLIALISLVAGIPLGMLLCRILGSASAFLEFDFTEALEMRINGEVILYALTAALISILVTIIPALKSSGFTIVGLKQKKARSSKKLWQKLYLDFIIFGVSLYGFYNFKNSEDVLVEQVLSGKALDPLLYLSSVLFILGAGMLFLRFHPLFVKLLFSLGKKKWSPSYYVSFLQTIRNGSSRQFIMLFLVLTVSLGIFNSTVARTIISNAEYNEEYLVGADIVLKEYWPSNELLVKLNPSVELKYKEPEYEKYLKIDGVESAARVYINDEVFFTYDRYQQVKTGLIGIIPKEFGETVSFEDGLLPYHINYYLNVLSQNPEGILCSAAYKNIYGLRLGDRINYSDKDGNKISGKILGFVDYWPTQSRTKTESLKDGTTFLSDNLFIVANLKAVQDGFGLRPYYVFLKTGNKEEKNVRQYLSDEKVKLVSYTNLDNALENLRQDTLFQGTNGILTMSFIIILVLCLAGYLIYWILSIKQRELLFGVFRAMGMKRSEIFSMLILEQILTGLIPIIIGGIIGIVVSKLYVPLIMIAYAGEKQVLPLRLTMPGSDFIKLAFAILVMMGAGIVVLANIIRKMNITSALKLGED
ncbi:MAG: ABC transporter permease [Lachnospiraceae bacterium]|nr:ABC transporter permease [Lachnospiraceae bacterium]